MIDVEEQIRRYACHVVAACELDRITAVSRFPSGERHDVYRVSYVDASGGAADLVVRVSTGRDDAERAQAEREARVLERVDGVAAPLLHDFRVESPWFDAPVMCMQLVPGEQRTLTAGALTDVEALGSVVAAVHEVSVDDLVAWLPTTSTMATYPDEYVATIESYLRRLRDPLPAEVRDRVPDALAWVHAGLERARRTESFATGDRLALLHGDIGADNIIWSPAPVLIDWEYARLGDPADEVGYIFGQHGLDDAQRTAFWRGYRRLGEAGDAHRLDLVVERVAWWEPATLLGSAMWWLERSSDPSTPKPPDYYLERALVRLDRFEAATARTDRR